MLDRGFRPARGPCCGTQETPAYLRANRFANDSREVPACAAAFVSLITGLLQSDYPSAPVLSNGRFRDLVVGIELINEV